MTEQNPFAYVYYILIVHLSVNEYLGWLHVPPFMIIVVMNMDVQGSLSQDAEVLWVYSQKEMSKECESANP